jgi:hypothetical protein
MVAKDSDHIDSVLYTTWEKTGCNHTVLPACCAEGAALHIVKAGSFKDALLPDGFLLSSIVTAAHCTALYALCS